jgi:hypothetical protein
MARQKLKQNITKYLKNQQHTQKDRQIKIWVNLKKLLFLRILELEIECWVGTRDIFE